MNTLPNFVRLYLRLRQAVRFLRAQGRYAKAQRVREEWDIWREGLEMRHTSSRVMSLSPARSQ